jgi:glycosyltransferase involved in cell wall biosynthesis
MPYTKVAEEMQDADTFILFSHNESGSCVLEEALCCGLPVISTPVGNKERVKEDNGLLVKNNDVQSLAEGMNTMINKWGQFNRPEISDTFVKQLSYRVIGRRIVDCYDGNK